MFERYTERARRALFFARSEVSELGGRTIETEHLLLGLLRQAKALTGDILDRAQLSADSVRAGMRSHTGQEKVSTAVEIPFSEETKRILQWTATEADRLGHNYIGTEHLLLGILCEPETAAGQILTAHGLTRAALRDEVARLSKPPQKN